MFLLKLEKKKTVNIQFSLYRNKITHMATSRDLRRPQFLSYRYLSYYKATLSMTLFLFIIILTLSTASKNYIYIYTILFFGLYIFLCYQCMCIHSVWVCLGEGTGAYLRCPSSGAIHYCFRPGCPIVLELVKYEAS